MRAEPLAGRTIGSRDGTLAIAEWTDDGETSRDHPVAPLHLHHGEDEAWYVLGGSLGFRVGDDEVEAPAGSAVLVPRGTPHTYWNAGGGRARYLLVMGPLTSALVEAIHAPGAGDLRELFERYDSMLLA